MIRETGDYMKKNRRFLFFLLLSVCVYVALLCILFLCERSTPDSQIDSFGDAFWFSIVTLSTVGYGDIYPVTVVGRFLGALIAFSGIAAVAIPTGIITTGLGECISRRNADKEASGVNGGHDGEMNAADCARLLQEQRAQLAKLIEAVARLNGNVRSGHNAEKANERT